MLLTDSNSERLLREGVAATVAAVFAGQFGATPTGQNRSARSTLVENKDSSNKRRKFSFFVSFSETQTSERS